jgi:hypothetical protein
MISHALVTAAATILPRIRFGVEILCFIPERWHYYRLSTSTTTHKTERAMSHGSSLSRGLVFVKVHFTVSPGSSLNVAILVVRFPLVVDVGDHRRRPRMPATPVSNKEAPAYVAGAFPPFILQAVTYFFFSYGYFFTRFSPLVEPGTPAVVKV